MKYCNSCNVKIRQNLLTCPLCEGVLEKKDCEFSQDYPNVTYEKNIIIWQKITLFFSIVSGVISILVNFFTKSDMPWSLIVVATLIYIIASYWYGIRRRFNIGKFTIAQVIGISLILILIDWITGFLMWSTNYVIPFLNIAAVSFITFAIIVRPIKFYDYIVYQFILLTLSVIPLLFILFKISTIKWTSASAAVCSGLILIGMFIFSDKKIKHELKKRLHF